MARSSRSISEPTHLTLLYHTSFRTSKKNGMSPHRNNKVPIAWTKFMDALSLSLIQSGQRSHFYFLPRMVDISDSISSPKFFNKKISATEETPRYLAPVTQHSHSLIETIQPRDFRSKPLLTSPASKEAIQQRTCPYHFLELGMIAFRQLLHCLRMGQFREDHFITQRTRKDTPIHTYLCPPPPKYLYQIENYDRRTLDPLRKPFFRKHFALQVRASRATAKLVVVSLYLFLKSYLIII